jgi:hypothetical protein
MISSVAIGLVLSLVLSLGVGLYLLAPFFESRGGLAEEQSVAAESVGRLVDSKERALRELKDLELDFNMGKISREDYERAKDEISIEVGRVLEKLRSHG